MFNKKKKTLNPIIVSLDENYLFLKICLLFTYFYVGDKVNNKDINYKSI